MKYSKYSVLISVYYKEDPLFLSVALDSIINQTYLTDDLVIICDGPLTQELDNVIVSYSSKYSFIHVYRLDENQGLGKALNYGVICCKNEVIMRMDSDDYSLPERAYKQLSIINNGADITSGAIAEFCDDYNVTDCVRTVPLNRKEIKKFIKTRSPFNHPCVMFKKSLVLSVGNYRNVPLKEDYDLWIRVFCSSCSITNTNEVLLNMRTGNGMIERRFSRAAKKSRKEIRKSLLHNKLINFFEFVLYSFAEFMIGILPLTIKRKIYKKVLRKKKNEL